MNTLNSYYLEAGSTIVPISSGYITLHISKNMAGSNLKFILRNNLRREIRTSTIPVQLFWSAAGRPEVPTEFDYECPLIGQAGRLVEINGPFDGKFSTTSFKVGGRQSSIVAESPRKLIFESPVDVIGATELELKEENIVVKRPFTNIRVVKIGQGGVASVHQIASQTTHNEQLVGPTHTPQLAVEAVEIESEIIEEVIVESAVEHKSQTQKKYDLLTLQINAPVSGVVAAIIKETEQLEGVAVEDIQIAPEAEIANSEALVEDINEEEIVVAKPDSVEAGIVGDLPAEEVNIELTTLHVDLVAGSTLIADIIQEQLSSTIVGAVNLKVAEPKIDTTGTSDGEIITAADRSKTGVGKGAVIQEMVLSKDGATEEITDKNNQIEVKVEQEETASIYIEDVGSVNVVKSGTDLPSSNASSQSANVDEVLSGVMPKEDSDLSETIQDGSFTVQVASFKKHSDAQELASVLRAKGYHVFVVEVDIPGKGRWNRVRVGTFLTKEEALSFGNKLKAEESTVTSVFIAENIKLDGVRKNTAQPKNAVNVALDKEPAIEESQMPETNHTEQPSADRAGMDENKPDSPESKNDAGVTPEDRSESMLTEKVDTYKPDSPESKNGVGSMPEDLTESTSMENVTTHKPLSTQKRPEKKLEPIEHASIDNQAIKPIKIDNNGRYTVQIGAFQDQNEANKYAKTIRSKGYPVFVKTMQGSEDKNWYRVRVGTFDDIDKASEYGEGLKTLEPEVTLVFITINE